MTKKLYGTKADQVPTNADLGTMAYQDSKSVRVQTIRADTAVGAGVDVNDDLGDNRFVVADINHGLLLDYVGSTLPFQAGMFTSSTAHTQTAYGDLNIKARTDYGGNYGIGFFTATSNNTPVRRAHFTPTGNLKFANGLGLDFSATEGGSASSSVLDDYEEGTWTPAFTASTTTISVNSATYTKIGRRVNLQLYIGNISPATSSDQQTITGLPFSVAGSDDYPSGSISYSVDADVAGLGVLAVTGGSYIYFHYIDGTKSGSATRNDFNSIKSSGLALIISISYNTA